MKNEISKIKDANLRLKIFFKPPYFLFLVYIFTFLFLALSLSNGLFSFGNASAQSSSNPNYSIEIQDIDTSPEKTIIVPQKIESNQQREHVGPVSGIESIVQASPLSFSVLKDAIDFGALTPGNPVTRTVSLSILSTSTDFQVISFEDHPLQSLPNQAIPDTTCDNGACDEVDSAEWKNNLTYGFGFRCDPVKLNVINSACIGFTDGQYYKQFSDFSKDEQPQTVIFGKKSTNLQQAQITLKVNASGTQKAENYTNTVTFIAVPNY